MNTDDIMCVYIYIYIHMYMDGGMEGWRDGGMEGWRGGGREGWMDVRRDGRTEGGMDGVNGSKEAYLLAPYASICINCMYDRYRIS